MAQPDPTAVRTVAVIGANTIGASWAAWFLARGLDVVASDPAPDGEARARKIVADAWPALTRLGLAPGASPDRLRFERDRVAAARQGDLVQESAPERLPLKQALLAELDAALPAERVIASSTSGFTTAEMQTRMRHPERLVVAHPFNPPHLIPLVEVVGGGKTASAAVDWAMTFYAAVGKHPIRLNKAVPGHLANRLQQALWREAIHMVAEGVASVADVDAAVAYGPGLRWAIMGPTLTFHLGGGAGGMKHFFDHFGGYIESQWRDLGSPILTPELVQRLIEGVADEAGGRSLAALGAERDACLLDILAALAKHRTPR
jgi:3-hydroxyacyl-CoA dehydrogenase